MSANQLQLLSVHMQEEGSAAYNIPMPFWLRGRLDPAALRLALEAMARRHDALRTTFAVDAAGEFRQEVRSEVGDIWREATAEDEDGALRVVAEDAAMGFDLWAGPVLRCTLVRVRADLHLLSITVHHVAFDGASRGPFFSASWRTST